MNETKAKLMAICSVLIFVCTAGTGWVWWRVLTMSPSNTVSSSSAPQGVVAADKPDHVVMPQEKFESVTVVSVTTTTVTSTPQKKVVIEKKLPKEFLLNVPFTSQAPEKNWDQPWQDACEEAAALMMDAYYKGYGVHPPFAKDEIIKMVTWEEEKGWGRSIEIEKIKIIFEQYFGLAPKRTLRIVEDPTVEQLKRFVADGKPVYVVADGKVLPNPHFQNGGPEYHALVIKGYTETQFITNDPGTQFGENFKYTHDDLMKSIRDWNNGNVKEGGRVVLVIE